MPRFKSSVEAEWNAYAEMLKLAEKMLRHAEYSDSQFTNKSPEEFKAARDRQMADEFFAHGLGREVVVIFCAFAFEAYLNHLNESENPDWKDIDRVPWEEKLTILSSLIGYNPVMGKRPFQTLKKLFGRRDRHAHGRSQKINQVVEHNVGNFYDWQRIVGIDWARITQADAERYLTDVKDAIERLNAARPTPDQFLFSSGSAAVGTTLLPSANSSRKSKKPTTT